MLKIYELSLYIKVNDEEWKEVEPFTCIGTQYEIRDENEVHSTTIVDKMSFEDFIEFANNQIKTHILNGIFVCETFFKGLPTINYIDVKTKKEVKIKSGNISIMKACTKEVNDFSLKEIIEEFDADTALKYILERKINIENCIKILKIHC